MKPFRRFQVFHVILNLKIQKWAILMRTSSLTHSLHQLRVVASSTSNDPGPRSRQHQQIGQRLLPLAAANFSVDDPAGASSQRREECRCVVLSLTTALDALSYHLIPRIRHSACMWKDWILSLSTLCIVHVSEPYNTTDCTHRADKYFFN